MKILYLSSVRIPTEKAAGLAIVRQCQAFVEIGHTVELLVPIRSHKDCSTVEVMYGFKPDFTIKKIRSLALFFLGKPGFYFMLVCESVKMFFYYLIKGKHDLIYSRDQFLLLAFVLGGATDKIVLELHTKQTDFVTRFVAKRVKKIIVISGGLKEYYERELGRNDITIEPSGVNLEQFTNLPDAFSIKKKLLLPLDKIIFGYVGKYKTMGEDKGVGDIIRAFARAYKKNNNIYLLLVGIEDSEKNEVLATAQDCELPSLAFLVLALDQKRFAEYVIASDVLLMNYPNSEHYAWYMSPTKLFAYLAVGHPIISSDLPSIRSVVDDEDVLFVKPGNVQSYAEAMIYAASNLSDMNRGRSKRMQLASKFNWKSRATRILDFVVRH